MNKIPVTVKFLKELAEISMQRGIEDKFISIALDWAEQANKYIEKLQEDNSNLQKQLAEADAAYQELEIERNS